MRNVIRKAVACIFKRRVLAPICYGWLAAQSGFFLWMLARIKSHGILVAVEPNPAILNAEMVIAAVVMLTATLMFLKEREAL